MILIFVGFERVCSRAHCWNVLDTWLSKNLYVIKDYFRLKSVFHSILLLSGLTQLTLMARVEKPKTRSWRWFMWVIRLRV